MHRARNKIRRKRLTRKKKKQFGGNPTNMPAGILDEQKKTLKDIMKSLSSLDATLLSTAYVNTIITYKSTVLSWLSTISSGNMIAPEKIETFKSYINTLLEKGNAYITNASAAQASAPLASAAQEAQASAAKAAQEAQASAAKAAQEAQASAAKADQEAQASAAKAAQASAAKASQAQASAAKVAAAQIEAMPPVMSNYEEELDVENNVADKEFRKEPMTQEGGSKKHIKNKKPRKISRKIKK